MNWGRAELVRLSLLLNNKERAMWDILQLTCTAIITLGGAGAVIISIIKWAHKPTDSRDETLNKHEDEIKNHKELLERDHIRLTELEEGNKILMRSMLALMSHAIDGNNTDGLRSAKDELQEYLIRR